LARLVGDPLCPNYVVAENALVLDDCSIYGAHELAQMLPLFGGDVYRRLWECNPHVTRHLPNAQPWPAREERVSHIACALKRGAERLLGGALGDWLEAWERRRKTDQLQRQQARHSPEIVFSPEQCKGHFVFQERLAQADGGTFLSVLPEEAERRETVSR
jgi:hypothetical protein